MTEKEMLQGLNDCICEQSENEKILKKILNEALMFCDLCSLCALKGQILFNCKCMQNDECIEHMIELFKENK